MHRGAEVLINAAGAVLGLIRAIIAADDLGAARGPGEPVASASYATVAGPEM